MDLRLAAVSRCLGINHARHGLDDFVVVFLVKCLATFSSPQHTRESLSLAMHAIYCSKFLKMHWKELCRSFVSIVHLASVAALVATSTKNSGHGGLHEMLLLARRKAFKKYSLSFFWPRSNT